MSSPERRAQLPGGGVVFSVRAEGNMSSAGGAERERGALNRELLRARLGLRTVTRSYQVHGTQMRRVVEIEDDVADNDELPHADGLVTDRRRVGLGVLSADCLPVALGVPGAVAVVHAGWRGLAAGALESALVAIRALAGGDVRPVAVIGPCAGVCCYEVGPEVHEALGVPARRGPIDLRAIAHRRLQAAQVRQVVDVGGCTICDERCFSHRREGEAAGRMMAVAWLD